MKLLSFLLKSFSNSETSKQIIHRHGHRCYSEGLNDHEFNLVTLLAKNLSPDKYFIFNNITLPSSFTKSTQVDHIVVSEYGIFVIESKDYKGWIFADRNSSNWMQVLYRGKKYPFQNPIIQNFAHISALKEQLPFLNKCFFNIVVFSNRSEFKTERINGVIYDDELISFIESKNKRWLKEEEVMMVIGKLSMLCQTNQVTHEEHVTNLNYAHREEVRENQQLVRTSK